jgi:cytochrome c
MSADLKIVMDIVTRLARILFLAGSFCFCPIVHAQQSLNTTQSQVKRHDLVKPTQAQDLDAGKSEFMSSCAPCHGTDAKGDGPLSPQLKTKPADLTVLAKKNGSIFPFNTTYEFIDGRRLTAAHGTREMPIWGQVYNLETLNRFIDPKTLDAIKFSTDPNDIVRDRILSLIDYLNRIQEKQ